MRKLVKYGTNCLQFAFFGIINSYEYKDRLVPLVPSDIAAVKTAAQRVYCWFIFSLNVVFSTTYFAPLT
jgi:hypothetical protein